MTDYVPTTLSDAGKQTYVDLVHKVLAKDLEGVSTIFAALSYEDLYDLAEAFGHKVRVDALLTGQTAYEIRARTPDGEWGKEVRKLATLCGVSDRTIHRWMSTAQEHFGYELTAAQANAAVRPSNGQSPSGGGEILWDEEGWDDEATAAGFTFATDGDPVENSERFRELVGEPGWGDGTLPSARYENADAPAPPSRKVEVPMDERWLEAQTAMIAMQHPEWEKNAEYLAAKVAKGRWNEAALEAPEDLLEDLEDVYGASGQDVPDHLREALLLAEENKTIKPEVVDAGPKKIKKPPAPAWDSILAKARDLHQDLVKLRTEEGEGAVAERYGGAVATLQSAAHTINGAVDKIKAAKRAAESGAPRPAAATADY